MRFVLRRVKMSAFSCDYCDYVCNTSSSLRSHKSRKHRDVIKQQMPTSSARCEKSKFPMDGDSLTPCDYIMYKSILTDKKLHDCDGLSKATDKEMDNIGLSLEKVLCKENYEDYFHVICLDTEHLETIPGVKEILPVTCKCFCNLLKSFDSGEQDQYINHVNVLFTDLKENWHQHCLVRFDKTISNRTRQYHFNKVFGSHNYRCIKINSMFHLMNVYLYILSLQSSKNVNCHLYSSYGFYLLPYQKAKLISKYKNLFPYKSVTEQKFINTATKKRKMHFSDVLCNIKKCKQ